MLGGHLLSHVLLVGQEFLETGSCKGERLPAKAHQVGILKPGVIEAVLNGGTGPVEDQIMRMQICKDLYRDLKKRNYKKDWCSAYHG